MNEKARLHPAWYALNDYLMSALAWGIFYWLIEVRKITLDDIAWLTGG